MSFEMVAILGRGIQKASENGGWDLTEDLEMCGEDSAHLAVRVPVDDENPYCMIGGGKLNQSAGYLLALKYKPKVIVCAYGDRSKYLKSIDAPSESEVMSRHLYDGDTISAMGGYSPVDDSEIVIWPRDRQLSVPSNTRQELLNIFDLALERGLSRIALVTVGVHVPRTATYVAKHLSVYEQYRELNPVLFESEEVLLEADRRHYGRRVEALRNSQAFARNWAREADGIQKIVRDAYGDAKPAVVAVTA